MPPKQKITKDSSAAPGAGKAITDPRFSNISSDPRYRLPSKKQTHVKLDKRFSHMMKDDDFTSTATVDRYGRKVPKTQGRKKLERLYEVADEDDDEDEDEDGEDIDVDVDVDDDNDVQKELARIEKKFDPARQSGFEESSSEEESSSDEEEEDVEDMVGEDDADGDAVEMGEVSRRLAIVNLDWDNIRATDLMAVASSFAPPEGRILDVTVFPSEYGKERMEREEQEGPDPELFANSKNARKSTLIDDDFSDASEANSDVDEEEKIKKSLIAQATAGEPEIDSRALRAYQLSRLRYYYAVVTCDSENTASALYKDMDGREYLSTSNFFDMRFVPDEVEFDDDKPRDTCTKVPDGYKPNEFVTEALTHSKVRLTWDEEDTNRKEVQKRAFSRQEVDENDLKAYIGSSSDDEDDDEDGGVEVVDGTTGNSTKAAPKPSKAEAARAKMRAALGLAEDKTKSRRPKADVEKSAPTGGMQITFTAGLSSTSAKPTDDKATTKSSIFKNQPEDVIEETTLDRYKRKEKERKARRKAKNKGGEDEDDLAAPVEDQDIMADEDGETKEDDPFNDPFFTDPAAANAAAKKAAKKAKRDAAAAEIAAAANAKQKEKAELELLMAGDGGDGTSLGERSFSMAAIRKAEKDAKKGTKGKKKKAKKGWKGEDPVEDDGKQVDDGFVMDVKDDRFKEAFENHDFAIDPSNPKFVETEGMKKLLQEGRKRRENVIGEDVVSGKSGKRKADRGGDGEVDDLVEKIKRRKAGVRS